MLKPTAGGSGQRTTLTAMKETGGVLTVKTGRGEGGQVLISA
jgi:hypothetical protein